MLQRIATSDGLTADNYNSLVEAVERLANLHAAPPLRQESDAAGWTLSVDASVSQSLATVEEFDGSPSVEDVNTLQFDQDAGFSVSRYGPGIARVTFAGGVTDFEVTSSTAVSDQYPGYEVAWDASSHTFTRTNAGFAVGLNGLQLETGYYQGRKWDDDVATVSFDNKSNSGDQTGTASYNWNHSHSGDNLGLAVAVQIFDSTKTATSVTAASTALTRLASATVGTRRIELWAASETDIGSAASPWNIAVTLDGSTNSCATAVTLAEVIQDGPEGAALASATNTGTATDASLSIDATEDGAWVYAAIITDDTSITAGQTARNAVVTASGTGADETTGPVTAGSTTMSYTGIGTAASWAMVGLAWRPHHTPIVLVNDVLIVKDVDGNPSYPCRELEFDQADGFAITNPSPGTVRIDFSGSSSSLTVEEQDGSPSYASTTTLQFHQDDGFVVSQPSANTVLIRQTGTITSSTITNLTLTSVANNSITYLTTVSLSSNQNNYSVGIGIYVLIINCTSAFNLTGIAISGGNNIGRPLTIINVGSAAVTLKHNSGSSSSGNQFYLPGAADVVIPSGGGSYFLNYGSQSYWNAAGPAYQSLASIAKLVDPGADRIGFWDDSASDWAFLQAANSITVSGTTLALDGDSASPGNYYFYSTDGSGTKGFNTISSAALPSGGFGSGLTLFSSGTLSASGTNQGNATTVSVNLNICTNADGTKGVILPDTATMILIRNNSGVNLLKVYPPSGGNISGLATDAAFSQGNSVYLYVRTESTVFYKVQLT